MARARRNFETLRSQEESDEKPLTALEQASPILDLVRKLKDSIVEKDRTLNERTRELKDARRRLENIIASIGDAVLVLDAEGKIESVNAAALELTGFEASELVGRPASELWLDPAHGELFSGERLQDLLRRGAHQRSDMALRPKRGDPIAVSWNGSPLRDGDRLLGLVGIARDVRVEKRLEEEKLRAVRALAASVAHEIRNPLGAIQNSVALLRRDLSLSGDDARLLEIVLAETERMGGIVSHFLRFARPSEPMLVAGDVGPILSEVALLAERDERARPAGEGAKRVEIEASVEGHVPTVRLDADKIKQVLWNLVSNALDAHVSKVALRARGAPGGVEVRVSDDGRGMAPDILARVFEPFRTTKARGTGLGLAISKSIVEAHGGSIRIESAERAGTTVSFTLPAREL